MRKTILAAAMGAAAAVPAIVHAQAAAPQSPHSVTGNVAIVSDYRFRGISQTFEQPAIQGGIDYSHSSGFYLGNWNSSVSGLSYADSGGIEMDFYGGFKKAFGDFGFDVGLLQYYYPGAKAAGTEKYDTLEAYVAGSWKWLTLKYSLTMTDWFGVNSVSTGTANGDSEGSGYLELNASYEIAPKLTLVGHIGQQTVKNYGHLDYVDYKIGATYDMSGWLLGAAYVDTDADPAFYTLTNAQGKSKDLGKGTVVLSLSKSF
jgi:uncharacterized protein (TIGR02001 family)